MAEKLKLTFDPYAYVRTAVMRTLLLKRDDYDKLLKMSFSEIAKYLQDSVYREEINELGIKFSGADLIEHALNKSLVKSFAKLNRISSGGMHEVIMAYFLRKDIWNIKTILRAKVTKIPLDELKTMLLPVGRLSEAEMASLMNKDSISSVIGSIGLLKGDKLFSDINKYDSSNDISEVENLLDKFYFKRILEFTKRLTGDDGRLMAEFFRREIDIQNITTILRFKKEGLDSTKMKEFLIPDGYKVQPNMLDKMGRAKDIESTIKYLKRTDYYKVISEAFEQDKNTLINIEIGLQYFLLKQSSLAMHQSLLSPTVILGYMFAKENEVRNLKLLLKGKQLGLDDRFISKQLVIA